MAACASAPCYLLSDHLGGTVGMTNNVGTVVSSQKYWPFGATRSGAISQTDKLYTGQQQEPGDSALGLYNYKARFYSTPLRAVCECRSGCGRAGQPAVLNPFSYVRNNPLSHTDPTDFCDPDDPRCVHLRPAPGEDTTGHNFLNDPGCDDTCAALVYLDAMRPFYEWLDANGLSGCFPWCGPSEIDQLIDWSHQQYENVFDLVDKCAWISMACEGGLAFQDCRSGSLGACAASTAIFAATALLPWRIKLPIGGRLAAGEVEGISAKVATGHAAEHYTHLDAQALQQRVEAILRNPSAVKAGAAGRVAYWDEASATIVIYDPGHVDKGTIFQPTQGRRYFDKFR